MKNHHIGKYVTEKAPANSSSLLELSKKSAASVGGSSKVNMAKKRLKSTSSFEQPKRAFTSTNAGQYAEHLPQLNIRVIDLDFLDESATYDRFAGLDLDGGWND
jgi:hypothetical protein